jgi:hypothetical protein
MKQDSDGAKVSAQEVFGVSDADILLLKEEVERLYKKHDTMTGLAHEMGLLARTKGERMRIVRAYIYGRIVEDNERSHGGGEESGVPVPQALVLAANVLAEVSKRAMDRGDVKTVQDIVEVLASQKKNDGDGQ